MQIRWGARVPKKYREIVRGALRASNAHACMGVRTVTVSGAKKSYAWEGTAKVSACKTKAKILVNFNASEYEILDTIFHESYHVHQVSTGALRPTVGGFWYYGMYIPLAIYNLAHGFIPFERAAIKYARKMVERLKELER